MKLTTEQSIALADLLGLAKATDESSLPIEMIESIVIIDKMLFDAVVKDEEIEESFPLFAEESQRLHDMDIDAQLVEGELKRGRLADESA